MPNTAGVEDVGNIVAAVRVIHEIAKTREGWGTIKLALREPKNIFVVVLADRSGVISEQAQPLLESALEGNLHRVVVCRAVGCQVVTVLTKIGEWKIRCLGGSGRKK